ncbi:MAG TPA: hypothetical protein VK168_17230 [Saprospiraceae bacterium]|nr:hypothetical protein [Saprospiraceae bacterium]
MNQKAKVVYMWSANTRHKKDELPEVIKHIYTNSVSAGLKIWGKYPQIFGIL